ncbi:decaheme-associated outer membrane protein, MtrB/PioB family [Burkholderiales bacterium]|nr:decaheme-associated outer membrane protein, MtrB/PioB family [Burkholderiales bacterium]
MTTNDRNARGFAARPLAAVIAALVAGGALAEPMLYVPLTRGADMSRYTDNSVEAGVGYSDEDSFRFGEFTGIRKSEAFFIGNANVRMRPGNDGRYLNAYAWNLGLPSRELGGEYGRQGLWGVSASYQQIHRYQFDDALFIHEGLGSNRLTLPAGFTGLAGQPPTQAAAVAPFLRQYDIKQERDILRVGGKVALGNGFGLTISFRQDERDGTKLVGAVMGNSGGNPRAAVIPYELNDRTQQVEASLHWASKAAQLNLSYWYSRYDNDNSSFTWQNPYAIIAGWAGASGFPTGYGRLAAMPSNDFHQFQLTGGWSVTPTTRLNGVVSYSIARQNESFLPYTINTAGETPGTSLSDPNALPRSSLDGEIRNTTVDLSVFSRPMPRLSVKARYRYQEHDNKTPSDVYGYVGGDTTDQVPVVSDAVNSTRIRRNLPPGTKENRFKVDADWQIARGTLLRGWYQYRQIDYEEAAHELRTDTDNNEFGAEIRKVMGDGFTGAVRYVFDQRRGSDYDNSRPYHGSFTSATTTAQPIPDNVPTLRHFFVSSYDKNLVRAEAAFSPLDRLSLTARADWYKMDYKGPDCGGTNDQVLAPANVFPSECLGRTEAIGESYTVDGSWVPMDGVNAFLFYTYSRFSTEQASRSWNNSVAQAISTGQNWQASLEYSDHTAGAGVRYTPASKQWDAGAQVVFSDGTGKTSLTPGSALAAPLSVPDIRTKLTSIQLFGKYQVNKNVLVRLNYAHERFRNSDWAFDNATPTSSNNVLLTGHQAPTYDANVFGVSVAYTGW